MLRAVVVAALAWSTLVDIASAAPQVTLQASLTPERLGYGTTVGFGFDVKAASGRVPPPLIGIEIRYPGNLGFALSGIGQAICAPSTLEKLVPSACPAEAVMGAGEALAELEVESVLVQEPTRLTILRGPTQQGHLALLFYADGEAPVSAQVIFPGLLLPARAPFGGTIGVTVPLVPSWPESSDLSVVRLRATLGPEHLTYYKHIHGRLVPYNPRGILLPRVCPKQGFRFRGSFHFSDGSGASATTVVPCPRHS
ncbi:MAG TPA: hypothetical protein VGX69_09010 [Solirubrobacteraceae bacterium]|jgi:hypothetical protein|nr:hypothetical protein [Solirubrobacteraceae bacterium]